MPLSNHEHLSLLYNPPNADYDLLVRPLGPDDLPDMARVRQQDLHRKYVESGLLSEDKATEYAELLEDYDPPASRHCPTELRNTGLYRRDQTGEELVAAQVWGITAYPANEHTDQLVRQYAEPGKDDPRPAFIRHRMISEAGQGYGTVIRHASALAMQESGFAVVGHKLTEASWKGHVEEIMALNPVLLRRNEQSVAFPVTPNDVYGTQRTEVYVGIPALLQTLEDAQAFLAKPEGL